MSTYGSRKTKPFGSSEMLRHHKTRIIFKILCLINEIKIFPEMFVAYVPTCM
jgi:hypothetical protein